MQDRMDNTTLDHALAEPAKRFEWHCDVEILLVGGAAGMITGMLPPERTTTDCDVIQYNPRQAWMEVERTADEIGRELGLPTNWLNSKVLIRQDCLPDGWRERRVWVYTHGGSRYMR